MRAKEPEIIRTIIPPYKRLAPYYDQLMDYIDYDIWVEDILNFIREDGSVKTLLDVSCGTGSMAIRFARAGMQVSGVDISPEMIGEARKKVHQAGLADGIELTVGDMRDIQYSKPFDLMINLHDGLNYLPDAGVVNTFFQHAHDLLRPEGWLIADVVTPLLCENHFKGYREIFSDESGGYERVTDYDSGTRIASTIFTFEISPTEIQVEEHLQRAYDLEEVKAMCKASPFKKYQILDDEDFRPADGSSERFYVILRKA
ncbi:MAG: class I SAM-dependent methyltransferase [Candidatus Marinimicrobia bacterium]|nr:class I SAM-dependent methyltransferase [Candidatus Neomarinimicrobiota bacterium]MCF7839193.1 class I SAM-dependent methyltransferase [Candidatus Neomarinimicrobiota bacterium]MCF7902374.1 class I SAM-dependent methyltransferase [Candidatus Neomarinimicrobiota bacterium]